MITSTVAPLIAVVALLFLFAAFHDIATRTVPNWTSLAILACGVALQFISGHLVGALLIGTLVFTICVLLWAARLLGGADVKLLAAAAVAVPPAAAGTLIISVALAGGLVAIVYLSLSHLIARPAPGHRRTVLHRILKAEAWRIHRRAPLPYVTAIAAGVVFTLYPGLP